MGATPTPTPTPSVAAPITAGQMLTAPVPRLCKHPAGTLTNGELRAKDPHDGGSRIALYPNAAWQRLSFRAWAGEDGAPYAALVMDCDRGGVAWPPHVVFYRSGPQVLGEIDVSSVVGNGRQGVAALAPVPGGVRLSLANTYQKDEDGCCGTLDVVADFTWDGSRARGEVVKRITEKATAKQAFLAALEGDKSLVEKLFDAKGRAEALHTEFFVTDPGDWREDFTCGSAAADQLFEGEGRDYDRACYFGAKAAYVAAFVAMKRVGFGTWRAAGIQVTTTD